ncbi:MAG: hypothetical protein CMH83_13890 [Nocardioides sp.]|nr:hypothetical protein [Nocardioides sp.]
MHRALSSALTTVLLLAPLLLLPSAPATATPASARVESTRAPSVAGATVYGERLRVGPGRWDADEVDVAYRWLRDGEPVRGATERTYVLDLADLGARMSVQVTATTPDGDRGRVVTEPTARVRKAPLEARRSPSLRGEARFTRTVSATRGRWTTDPTRVRYQWLVGGAPVAGATGRRYAIRPEDVGRSLRVRVTAKAPGHTRGRAVSDPVRVQHRVPVRRTATYSVTTRGRVGASVKTFKKLAQQTFDDPRGWRGKGVAFRRVASGGSFTLVLAEASAVPSFSSQCSSQWSCRVGRYVVINQTRWQHASPAWNGAGRSLRDYRHMVVNHEVGHWLGKGHASCPGPGRLAPVMMQQSKGTQGCRLNPWPTAAELR